LIRAVRRRLAARAAGLSDFFVFLPFLTADFAGFLLDEEGFSDVREEFGAGFRTGFFAAEEEEPADATVEPAADCPATGCAAINRESKPARQRDASRKSEVGENESVILPL
jgi:hypothetical protein